MRLLPQRTSVSLEAATACYSCRGSPKVHTGSTTWSAYPPVVVPHWGSSEGTPLLSQQHPIHWYRLTSIISPQMNWLQRALSDGLHFGASNLQVCWVWQAAGLPFKSGNIHLETPLRGATFNLWGRMPYRCQATSTWSWVRWRCP